PAPAPADAPAMRMTASRVASFATPTRPGEPGRRKPPGVATETVPAWRRQQRRAAPGAAETLRLRSEGRIGRNVRVGRPKRLGAPRAGRSGEQSVYQGYVIMG